MKMIKKIGLGILDFTEVVMPVLALLITFISFIVNVVARYIANAPLNSCYELCLAGLVWCLLLSAPYAVRKHNNVQFTMLYDHMNAVGQMVFRIIGNGFLIFCFAIMLYPCYDWVHFMQRKYTAVLQVRMDIIYSPFVVFNVLTLAHLIYDFVRDVIRIVRAVQGKEHLTKEVLTESDMALEGGEDE